MTKRNSSSEKKTARSDNTALLQTAAV